MRMKRLLLLCFACVVASLRPPVPVHSQNGGPALAIARSDGSVWTWDGTEATPERISGVAEMQAAGRVRNEILFADSDGNAWLWDPDAEPRLARMASVDRIHSIACVRDHCLAVTGADRVVAWWGGDRVDPIAGLEDVAAVTLSDGRVLALSHTGIVWTGDEGALERLPGLAGATSIAAGARQSIATLSDGSVWVWGRGAPERVAGVEGGVQAAAAGNALFVLTGDGELWSVGEPGGARHLESPGEMARFQSGGGAVLAERSDGRLWDCQAGRELQVPHGHEASSTSRVAGSDGPGLSGTAVLLVGKGTITQSDAFVSGRLRDMGLTVRLVHQEEARAEALDGAAVVVMSSSVEARDVDAAGLAKLDVPIVTWERFLFSPLGLTRRDRVPGHGSILGRRLSILRPTHPLAAGLPASEEVAVLDQAGALTGASPASNVRVIAVGPTGLGAVFALDGRSRTGSASMGRRVGLFLPAAPGSSLTAQGAALLDAAVRWAVLGAPDEGEEPEVESPEASGQILLVVASGSSCTTPPPLSSGDAVYKSRMETLGFTVVVKKANCATSNDATSKQMVMVSHTAPNGDITNKFTNVTVPVAIQSRGLLDDMMMAGSVGGTDHGTCGAPTPSTQANVNTPSHPIAGGLTGIVSMSTLAGFQEWGAPSASATRVLTCVGESSTHSTTFVYETGAVMVGMNAPARRTMWGFYEPIPSSFTATGRDVFNRMVLWTTNTTGNQAPIADAGPDQGAWACEPPYSCTNITLYGHAFDDGLPVPPGALTYQWIQVFGPGTATFGSPNQATTTVSFDNTGIFRLRLTVSDGALSDIDDVEVEVFGEGSNVPPVVDAGPMQYVDLSTPATLNGSADDDGLPNPPGVMTYQWSKVTGPGTVTFAYPNLPQTTATFSLTGVYVLRLTASDSVLSAYDDVVVTVNQSALLVVGDGTNLSSGDAYLKARMEALGFPVVVVDDSEADNGDAVGKRFVWLSSTTDTNELINHGSPFVNVGVPVALQASGYVFDMGMSTGSLGTVPNQTQVTILPPTHALSAGLLGTVTTSGGGAYDWGTPGGQPISVARLVPNPLRHPVFAYEQNSPMVNGVAPARRLFFGFQDDAVPGLTGNGRRLLDAAIYWIGNTNAAPWVNAGPSQMAVLNPSTAVVNLAGYVTDDLLPNPPGAFTSTWSKLVGPANVTFGNASQPATTATFTQAGDYVLKLTASDSVKTASDLTFVTIVPPATNGAPSVSAGPDQTIRLPQKAYLTGTAADDGLPLPSNLSATWTKVFGPGNVTFNPQNAASTVATFLQPGVFVLKLTASDGSLSASDEVQVTVEPTLPALFVVSNQDFPVANDVRAQMEMEASGFSPVLRTHSSVTPGEASGKAFVAISSSIPPASPVGNMFYSSTTPVILWETPLYDDMGMTGANGFGDAQDTLIEILDPSHPMAANLAGEQEVYSVAGTLDWGMPAVAAFKVASVRNDATKLTVFGYERGAAMVSGNAPARRVGVFATEAAKYTETGASLFRAAVRWAAEKPVTTLLVVANPAAMSATDLKAKERMEALGYEVVVADGDDAQGSAANGKAFVVISNSLGATNKFLSANTAVIVWQGFVMQVMNMVSSQSIITLQTQLTFSNAPPHPLAAGLSGTKAMTTADTYTWGVPGAAAAKIATIVNAPSQVSVFGYEVGDNLVTGQAVDRRVGLFFSPATGGLLTPDGVAVLDAAIRWAASSDPDEDGLGTADEYRHNTDPHDADSNDDGLLDGAAVAAGVSPTSNDVDGDGVLNSTELVQGTDPFSRDTDGDGATDLNDCFPLDPTRTTCPNDVPGIPTITLQEPTNAIPVGPNH